jgi:ATP-dependent DNA ligase
LSGPKRTRASSTRSLTRRRSGRIELCLPSSAKAPPGGPDWLYEIKHDGFRILARRDARGVHPITRNGNDFTKRFPHVVTAVGCEGIVSKRLGSTYRSGRSKHWLKVKNPAAPAVWREAEEEWHYCLSNTMTLDTNALTFRTGLRPHSRASAEKFSDV